MYSEAIHVYMVVSQTQNQHSYHISVMPSPKLLRNDAGLVTTTPLCPLIKINLPGNIFSSQMNNFLKEKEANHNLNNNQKFLIVQQE